LSGSGGSGAWCKCTPGWYPCKNHRDILAGQFLENPPLSGVSLASPSPVYLFSKSINWLDFDPTYPKNPKTLGDYIRKYRMEKGLLIKELAKELGVTEDTVINWEVRGVRPCGKHLERITGFIPALARLPYAGGKRALRHLPKPSDWNTSSQSQSGS
jgi:DNA-binding XRE family transcriptional regulator